MNNLIKNYQQQMGFLANLIKISCLIIRIKISNIKKCTKWGLFERNTKTLKS